MLSYTILVRHRFAVRPLTFELLYLAEVKALNLLTHLEVLAPVMQQNSD